MLRFVLTILAMSLCLGQVFAQSMDPYRGTSPEELLTRSWDTPSGEERADIRVYLAEMYPGTPQGLFARAWVADRNGAKPREVIDLYEQAVAGSSGDNIPLLNLALAYERAEDLEGALAVYELAMQRRTINPTIIRNTYFLLANDFKDKPRADRFLDEAERTRRTEPFFFDFVRGIAAQSDGDLGAAEILLERAYDQGGDFEVLERLTNLRMTRLEQSGASRKELINPLQEMLAYAVRENDAEGFLYTARELLDRFKAHSQSFDYFEKAYETYPMAEAATEGFTALANYHFERSYALLERAAGDLPQLWKIKAQLSWANYNFRYEPDLAERYGRESIELAGLSSEIRQAGTWLGDFYEQSGRFDEAERLYETLLPRVVASDQNSLRTYITDNRLLAQDFDAADAALQKMPEINSSSSTFSIMLRDRIKTAKALADEREDFFDTNPFLRDWEQRFGASLKLAVEFETASDKIRDETYSALDEAAQALNTPGGEKYVFLIEGHTDSRGSDEVNMPLSNARANAVAGYLKEQHGLPASRLRTVGYGPRQPIATNETDAGRQRNRRVEIRPFGNVADPEIAVTSALSANSIVVSPDGRFGAVGSEPVQLWDLDLGVKVRDFYRGGWERAFSPNGRYIAATSSYTEVAGGTTYALYIYDIKTGHAVAQIYGDKDFEKLAWSPFSDAIAFTENTGFLKVYDIARKSIRAVTRIGTQRITGSVVWLADGERIATGQAQNKGVKIWDARSLRLERELEGPDWTHMMGQAHDGRYLFAVDNQRMMHIWDTNNWNNHRQFQVPVIPNRVSSHPSKPWVLMNDKFESSDSLLLLDLSTGQVINKREGKKHLSVNFTPDGTQFIAGKDQDIIWFDTATLLPTKSISSPAPNGRGLTLDTLNDHVISRDDNGSYVWDLTTGSRVHSLQTRTTLGWKSLSKDGSRQITVDSDNNIVVFDTESFREEKKMHVDFSVSRLLVGDAYIVLAGKPIGDDEKKAEKGIVQILDHETLAPLSRIEIPFFDGTLYYDAVYRTDFNDVSISSKAGLLALSTRWQDGYGHGYSVSRNTRIFDVLSGKQVKVISSSQPGESIDFDSKDAELVRIQQKSGGWYVYQARDGKYVRFDPATSTYTHKLEGGGKLEWSRDTLRIGDRAAFFPGTIRSVVVDEKKNLIVAQTGGNELMFFDLARLERQLTIVVKNNDEWIAYAPSGEFTASLDGAKGVFWSLGDNYLPFEALRSKFEQPRIIRDRLSRLQERADLDRDEPDKPNVDPELFEVPYKVTLASSAREEVDTDSYVLRLRVEKSSADLADPEFEYKLNGRVVLKSRGFDEEAVYDGGEIVGIDRKFSLQEGDNLIEASLVYKDARVLTQQAEIRRKAIQRPAVLSTTQLWFFGVGVSDYAIARQNLDYAHKDALELEKQLKRQEGVLFSKVNTKVLVNEDATERNIRIEMNDFLRQASAEDVIIVFLAGHGVQDNEQNLYLITHDGDIDRPYTGMQIDKFRDFLSGRPINQKALFLMDICHAGTAGPRRRGRITAEDAVRELSAGTGTIVLASSTGAQSSLEDESFGGGHGAFTAALLEGLKGQADKDAGDRNGFTSVQELISYTARRVPQMTQGQQHPTIPLSENVLDFPLSSAD
tara:strand:+ start:8632 stop:13500 length:4869 start_codon:yes stop_codon:yes gene_type:complete